MEGGEDKCNVMYHLPGFPPMLSAHSHPLQSTHLLGLRLKLRMPFTCRPSVAAVASSAQPSHTPPAFTLRMSMLFVHPSIHLLHLPVLSGVLPSTDVELMDWMEDRLRHNTQVGAGTQRERSGKQGVGDQM